MSERGAEGILRRQAEAKAAAKPAPAPQPVDQGTAGAKPPGRAKSAAVGAAGGSAGGPAGAALGAVTGALTGGKGKRKSSSGRRALVAEFMICMAMLGLSPLVDKGGDVTTSKFMKKASATAAVFIILGFISSAGDTARKVANGLGLLMTLTVLLNERSAFGSLVKAVNGEGVPIPKATHPEPNPDADPFAGGFGNPAGGSFQEQYELGGGVAADAGRYVNQWLRGLFDGAPTPQSDGFVQSLQEPGATWGGV